MVKVHFISLLIACSLLANLLTGLEAAPSPRPQEESTADLEAGGADEKDLEGAASFGYGYYSSPYLGGYYGGYWPHYSGGYYGLGEFGYPYYGGYYGLHHHHGHYGHYY